MLVLLILPSAETPATPARPAATALAEEVREGFVGFDDDLDGFDALYEDCLLGFAVGFAGVTGAEKDVVSL